MPKIRFRERIANRLAGDVLRSERKAMQDALDMLMDAYRAGPAVLSPATLEHNLREMDSQMLDMIMRQRGYVVVSGQGLSSGGLLLSENDRLRAVNESRHMVFYDVQAKLSVETWTNFGFGQSIDVKPIDPVGKEVWDEFVAARRNQPLLKQRKIQKMSNDLLVDGEQFLVDYISTIDGKSTLRKFMTDEVNRIVYANDDPDVPLFYVRTENGKQVLYPDFAIDTETIAGHELQSGQYIAGRFTDDGIVIPISTPDGIVNEPATIAVVIPAMINEINLSGQIRGFPQFIGEFPWNRTIKQMLGDRATDLEMDRYLR